MAVKTLTEHLFETGTAGFDAAAHDHESGPDTPAPQPSARASDDDDSLLPDIDSLLPDILAPAASTDAEAAPLRRSAALTSKGDDGKDKLNGTAGADKLSGEGGDDKIKGKGGNDKLFGGDGDDKLIGGGGDDSLKAGGGDDTLVGGGGDDTLKGQGGGDVMRGGGGDDIIKGQGGADLIKGNGGSDLIVGGGGDDTIQAGPGDDTLKGGGGNDIFLFAAADFKKPEQTTIKAFQNGRDKIDLVKLKLGDFSDLDFSQDGKDAILSINKGQIVFAGKKVASFDADDFLLDQADRDALTPVTPVVATTPTDTTTPVDTTTPTDPVTPTDPTTPTDTSVTGDEQANALDGDANDNEISGLGGNDTLGGGEGADTLIGGGGSDVFAVQLVNGAIDPTVDVVKDFSYAIDFDAIGLLEVLNGVSFAKLSDVVDARIVGLDTIISVRTSTADAFQDVLKLEGVQFTTTDLESNAFIAPAANTTAFIDNPFGFENGSRTTADPDATSDGRFVVWVDQQNLDNDQFDFDPNGTSGNAQNAISRDVFIMNTSTLEIRRVSLKKGDPDAPQNDRDVAVSPVVSDDGRFVAYVQGASNANGNVFVRDMSNPDVTPVQVNIHQNGSAGGAGTEILKNQSGSLSSSIANDSRSVIDMSADGTRVVFSTSSSLSTADTGSEDVYLRDLTAGTTTLLTDFDSTSSGSLVKITDDGRYVLLTAKPAGATGDLDLFLVDTQTGDRLQVSSLADGEIGGFDISADGTRIVFETFEAITAADTNGLNDLYVADIDLAGFTVTDSQRVSVAEGQFQLLDRLGPGFDDAFTTYAPIISPDGTKVLFLSGSLDLVSYGDQIGLKAGNVYEKMYLLDLTTGAITVPDAPYALADDRSVDTNAVFTDTGFFYPTNFTSSDGSGSVAAADSIIFGTDVAPGVDEVGNTVGSASRVEIMTSVRSQIDSATDADVFFLPDQNNSRDVVIFVAGVDSGGGDLADPDLRVLNSSGALIATNNDTQGDPFLVVDGGDDLFIEVTSNDGGLGSYRVSVLDQDFASRLDDLVSTPDPFMF